MAWSKEHRHRQKYHHHCCHEVSYGMGSTMCIRCSTSAMLHMHGVLPAADSVLSVRSLLTVSGTHTHTCVNTLSEIERDR